MVVDKGLDPTVADKIGTFVLQSGSPKDLWAILTEKKTFGDHIGNIKKTESINILLPGVISKLNL